MVLEVQIRLRVERQQMLAGTTKGGSCATTKGGSCTTSGGQAEAIDFGWETPKMGKRSREIT